MVSTPSKATKATIESSQTSAEGSKATVSKPRPSVTPRKRLVVEIESPRKRRASIVDGSAAGVVTPERKQSNGTKATPLNRSSPSVHRGSPTPRSKSTGTKSRPIETPLKAVTKTPRTAQVRGTPTLGASVKKTLPTPRSIKGKGRAESPTPDTGDDTFGSNGLLETKISRETFLANEALRRQKEARNFEYEGDANAPKLTRSGRVIRGADEDGEVDEYGGGKGQEEDQDGDVKMSNQEEEIRIRGPEIELDEPIKEAQMDVVPLPAGARPHVLQILSTLTSQNIAVEPPPFPDEDTNEALQGLVNLLKGTVERGEGNSALVVGSRGVGKNRTVARALKLLPSSSKTSPIVVRLSGHAQTNDRLAIREIGRQIAEAEGIKVADEQAEEDENDVDDQEYAPTTLPSHLLALLTAPSPRAIIIIMEEFDLFTEHARQALLYCLLDVVQSVKTGDVKATGRGVAVIGLTSRIDTLLLLEKRVKSRFSHRMWRIASPLSSGGDDKPWRAIMMRALVPWQSETGSLHPESEEVILWKDDWQFAIETLLDSKKVVKYLERLTGLTTDIRLLYKPFIPLITSVLSSKVDLLSVADVSASVLSQVELSGWGLQTSKLRGLPHAALGTLIISKHLHYAGRDEFNFAQVEEEYLRFSRTKLVGSGKTRWPIGVLRMGYDHLSRMGILVPASNSNIQRRFARVRCTISPHEIVAWMRGEGASGLGPELVSWGRMMGGHA